MKESNKQASYIRAEMEGYQPLLEFASDGPGLGSTLLIDTNNPDPTNRISTDLP